MFPQKVVKYVSKYFSIKYGTTVHKKNATETK